MLLWRVGVRSRCGGGSREKAIKLRIEWSNMVSFTSHFHSLSCCIQILEQHDQQPLGLV